jgi:hypothetical protein
MSTTDSGDLFHYTGTTGIKGILSTRKLWATDIGFLNDTSEGTIPDGILRRLSKMTVASRLSFYLASKWLAEKSDAIPKSRFFVACFCKHSDLLSQWRGYSPGLTGYALGFNKEVLKRFARYRSRCIEASPIIEECIYINEDGYCEIEAKFRENLSLVEVAFDSNQSPPKGTMFREGIQWLEGPNEAQKRVCEALLNGFWVSVIEKLERKRPFLKPDAFREESETRIVVPAEENLDILWRDNSNNLIPYVEIDISEVIENGGLKCIVVGPSAHHGRAIRGLEQFLDDKGIPGVQIFSTAATFSRH